MSGDSTSPSPANPVAPEQSGNSQATATTLPTQSASESHVGEAHKSVDEPLVPCHPPGFTPSSLLHDEPVARPASTTAREATAEDETPGAIGKKYPAPMSHERENTSSLLSSVSEDLPASHSQGSGDYDHSGGSAHLHLLADAARTRDSGVGLSSPTLMTKVAAETHEKPMTEIRAGLSKKPFNILSALLVAKSPYFAAMQSTHDNPQPAHRLAGPFFFPDFDEFAFEIFTNWIHGTPLHGPTDFHSMHHYLCLYILARRFQIENLENHVVDVVRKYYEVDDMTASPFRLEYIYNNTAGPNMMRTFLVSTAAYRSVFEAEKGNAFSDSMALALKRGGDLAVDFAQAVLAQFFNDREDARHGDPCRWHEHTVTKRCEKWAGYEPWEAP